MRVMNFNNLNSERIMKTEITDHELSKIAEDWYNGIEYINTGLKTAFVAGYRYAERKANGQDTGERQLTIPDVSEQLPIDYTFEKMICGICGHFPCMCHTPLGNFR
jgi:hypothetical protein